MVLFTDDGVVVGEGTAKRGGWLRDGGAGCRVDAKLVQTFVLNQGLWVPRVRLEMESHQVDWIGTRS